MAKNTKKISVTIADFLIKYSAKNDAEIINKQAAEIALLSDQVASLTQQLDWFKRQLFGRKSEKQIEPNPFQSPLFEAPTPTSQEFTQTVKAHKRKRQK